MALAALLAGCSPGGDADTYPQYLAKLTASDGAEEDQFGVSVAIDGDYIVAGAMGNDDKGSSSGSAYVFQLSGGAWTQVANLTASDGDNFGYITCLRIY